MNATLLALTIPTVLVSLVSLVSTHALPAVAHGGSYRGPGAVVPPAASGGSGSGSASGGSAPIPAGPSTAGPTTPGSGAPTAPGFGGGARPTAGGAPRGIEVGEDLSKWQYWWEFNKDDYLAVKDMVHAPERVLGSDEMFMGASRRVSGRISAKPSSHDIDQRILPAIHQALLEIDNRDVRSACLIALAKIGRDHVTFSILPIFRAHLCSPDQEIRETAALALGLSHMPNAESDLLALVADTAAGRALTGRGRVDSRTRAFAAYGLGLLVHSAPRPGLQTRVLHALRAVLLDASQVDRNLKVAAIKGLALLGIPPDTRDPVQLDLRARTVAVLEQYYSASTSAGREVIRAHVPPAIARLIGRGNSPQGRAIMERFARELGATKVRSGELQRSAAIALGSMALPAEQVREHGKYSKLLRRHFALGKDAQTRFFAIIALAQIGGAGNRNVLLELLASGKRTLERPWIALALGILSHRERSAGAAPDETVGRALHKAFLASGTPYVKGAIAVALGLTGHTPAGRDILDHLRSHGHQDEMSGYLCVGLALMNFDAAKAPITDLLDNSMRRPHRLRMAAVALGKLGDRRLTRRLVGHLDQDPDVAKMAAVATALAQIGDRDSIAILREVLADARRPEIAKAFAVVALGAIADKEARPWNAKLASDMNYRAAVETLVESGSGVLEIL